MEAGLHLPLPDEEQPPERDPEKPPITAEQRALMEAQIKMFEEQAKRRVIGWLAIGAIVIALLLPVLIILGFETGLFVTCFNLTAHIV